MHAGGAQPPPSQPAAPPRLVVLLVLDQWPEWAFDQHRPHLHAGGFDRLLADGAWHVGRHPSAATLTAPGHALLGTGESPAASGILANEWWHRDVGRMLHAVEAEDGSVSAKWLRVPGLGDALAAAGRGGKAVAVSLKDRAAVLPLGHAGTPIWYDAKRTAWASLAALPWLDDYNRTTPVSARLHEVWTPLDARALAAMSGRADDAPGEIGEKHFGATFPHDPQATGDAADALYAMPLGNDLVLDLATHAIDAEHLGADAVPDLLVVSLSAHDYVGHGWGHESWEMWDLEMRLDTRIAAFLSALDAKVGAGKWAMIVTSDHGAAPTPDPRRGGHVTYQQIASAVQRVAIAELGEGQWVSSAKYPSVWLTPAALAVPVKDRDVAIKKMIYALRSFPGLEHVERTDVLTAGGCDRRRGDARAMCLSLDPERSGEICVLPGGRLGRPGPVRHVRDRARLAARLRPARAGDRARARPRRARLARRARRRGRADGVDRGAARELARRDGPGEAAAVRVPAATARLTFRAWRDDDLPVASAIFGDPRVTALVGGPFDDAAIAARLATELANQRTHGIAYWPLVARRHVRARRVLRPQAARAARSRARLLPRAGGVGRRPRRRGRSRGDLVRVRRARD